ncbi:MAG: winged helix-turn-helix transcriptional regulator [Chloroflexia bacterium]|nr:winged helix-turn-helix transcriptional regulator [Chloroflexia bacterium]
MTVQTDARSATLEHLAALADPTRFAILALLRRRDQCVCHVVEELGLKQSVVSHHVGVLRRAGLISSYPHATDRRWLYYRLNRDALDGLAGQLSWLLDDGEYDPTPLPCAADAVEGT